ncbi:hypothetical protein [Acuticoccus kandeliae]|uniref:hypothetical protein n=1 Tax=Acuticoccus kandeliae TaxID=2073160 RepID=UPI001300B50C|nr:hypothetical protein [Acuticoccus kandeliae]
MSECGCGAVWAVRCKQGACRHWFSTGIAVDAAALVPPETVTATCPVCAAQGTWTADEIAARDPSALSEARAGQ